MEKVLGIDLGTSNSCVSVIHEGKPFVIPDRDGHLIQPSIVYFQSDGRVVVGSDAKAHLMEEPENTVSSAKRLIGRKIFSSEVKKAQALMPYEIIEGENQSPNIEVHGKKYSLQEISAMILMKMKAIADEYFQSNFTKAVITVPAYFNDNQRAATKDAGQVAGLEVLRIINEPTAAALAYGYGKKATERVAVYDLGGGTFDISILELGDGVFEVVSTAGDTYLGGDDFEERIMDWVLEKFKEEHQVDLRADRHTLQQVKDASEKAKHALTESEQAHIFIPAITTQDSSFIDLDYTINRSEFNHLISDLIQKTFQVCDEAMQLARFTPSDIDGVILVGGSTRVPTIREGAKRYFQKEPKAEVNPDQVVSIGACIQGSALQGESSSEDVVLVDLTPLSLGIEIRGGLVEHVIEQNTPLPVDHTKIFTTSSDNQQSVSIRVFQGESRKAAENELLGEFTLEGLRAAPASEVTVAVQFEIDTDGILNVSAKDVETGTVQSVSLKACGRLSQEQIDELRANASGGSGESEEEVLPELNL